uniref:LysR substrate-binding domain-containing protein n=1 Tax=Psychrobacter sp. (strain PRwf-1) TaxID=349106 RepID=A5WED6_PSYWF
MARLILTCNTLSTDHDSVCRLISTPEVGGFTATGDKFNNSYSSAWPLYIEGTEQLLAINGRFLSNHLSAIKQAALANLGIAFLPQALVYDELKQQTLVQILSRFTRKKMGMYAVYPKARQPDQKLKRLVDHLGEALRQKQAYYC